MKYCNKCMNPIGENDATCSFCGAWVNGEIPSHHLIPGTILNNKFMVGEALGEGGFGITYIGMDTKLEMKVAIKEYYPSGYVSRSNTLSPSVSSSTTGERKEFFENGRERFLREAQILAKFSGSQGIVNVRDFFEENNTAYIVMEYLEGQTLKEYLKSNGTLSPGDTLNLLLPVMESLKKVHEQGLIHRDISPDNIMLVDGCVKLLDFGAARNVSAIANKSISVMLKPGYAPEEQYRSKGNQGPWTDVYALSATIYKCITGITPDDSTQRVFSDELKAPSALGVDINPVYEKALLKGLSVLQRDRYQDIDSLLNGFKGMDAIEDDDSKTVFGGAMPVEDDKPTEYRGIADDDKTVVGNEAVTMMGRTQTQTQRPVQEPAKEPVKTPIPEAKQVSKSKVGAPTKIGIVLLSIVLAIVVLVGSCAVFSALNSVTIGGEKVSKSDTRVRLSDVTVTEDDMKAIISMGKLEEIQFSYCEISDSIFKYLSDIPAPVTSLQMWHCTGLNNYSSISDIKYLNDLQIVGCELTDEELEGIKFKKLEYLQYLDLSENPELTDITPLSSPKALTNLNLDKTAVRDFKAVKDCEVLQDVSAQECGITDISTLTNKTIGYLYLNKNEISDISSFAEFEYLSNLEICDNKISDISALADKKALHTLHLDGNMISDISALSSTPTLSWLQISDNQVTSLQALSDLKNLTWLSVNRNRLTNLDGLENSLRLENIEATENQIENINGLINCTVLETFNINENKVSDISLLKKSAATLEKVFFNGNNVSDISCLQNATKLEYLSFDYNKVGTLEPLKNSKELQAISAEYNEILTMEGLRNSTKLKYIYLPHNNISDMSPVANLAARAENDFAVVDLSSNKIAKLQLSEGKEYSYLAVYNNPIKSFEQVENASGQYFLFSYVEGMSFKGFDEAFSAYNIIDCPKDKQVGVYNSILDPDVVYLTRTVAFSTVEEADKQIRDTREMLFGDTTRQEEVEE